MPDRILDSKQPIPPVRFAHFVKRTKHFSECIDWYEKVLGAHVVTQNDFIAFMTYDEEHHRLALVNVPNAPDAAPGAQGVDHVAYTFKDMGDLLSTYRRLKGEGILPSWTINHGPTTSLYYTDPDGIRVELQIDNFPTAAELDAWFRSGEFAENPIGVEFDPENLLKAYEEGVPESELVKQSSVP